MQTFHITCYSLGLYSSFCFHRPSRTLFDVGSGVGCELRNHIFAIERICISHGCHSDHISDLPLLVGLRNSARGDKEKPLDIYYPEDDMAISDYKEFIKRRMGSWLTYRLNWLPINVGHKIPLDSNHWIESFKLEHTRKSTTLGYKLIEARTRLKPEYRLANIPELLKAGLDKSQLNEPYNAITLAYCLDNYRLDTADIVNADLAIMDCSFLSGADRDEPTHATLEEAVAMCNEARVKQMVAAHFSSRYNKRQIMEAVAKTGVFAVLPDRVYEF